MTILARHQSQCPQGELPGAAFQRLPGLIILSVTRLQSAPSTLKSFAYKRLHNPLGSLPLPIRRVIS